MIIMIKKAANLKWFENKTAIIIWSWIQDAPKIQIGAGQTAHQALYEVKWAFLNMSGV